VEPNDFTYGPTCVVLDVNRDADMLTLVGWHAFWRVSGPRTLRRAITWLVEHPDVALTDRVPDDVRSLIEEHRS